jgi:hypothetical protein
MIMMRKSGVKNLYENHYNFRIVTIIQIIIISILSFNKSCVTKFVLDFVFLKKNIKNINTKIMKHKNHENQ